MRTEKHPVAVLTSPDDAQFGMNQVWQDPDLMTETLGNLANRSGGNPAMQAANTSVGGAVSVANRLKSLGTTTIPPTGFGYGTQRLRQSDVDALVDDPLEPGNPGRVPLLRRRLRLPRHPGNAPGREPRRSRPDAQRVPGRPRGQRSRRSRDHAGVERVRPPDRGQRLRRRRHRPRRRWPGDGDRKAASRAE